MSGELIRNEVAQALAEASSEVGAGPLVVMLRQRDAAPATPWSATEPTDLQFPLRAVRSSYDRRLVDGVMVQAEDIRLVVEAVPGVRPKPTDTVAIDGEVYSVITARPVSPGSVALMWELQCRR